MTWHTAADSLADADEVHNVASCCSTCWWPLHDEHSHSPLLIRQPESLLAVSLACIAAELDSNMQ
jgi:hypothetical protein